MRRTLGLAAFVFTAVCGLTLLANEKPTAEHQDIMKSNAATNAALRMHTTAKDYDAIAKDADTLKANFTKIETFWTQRKVDDAIKFAQSGKKAAEDLADAAKKKDDAAIASATMALTPNCGGCHMAHRQQLPDKTFEIK